MGLAAEAFDIFFFIESGSMAFELFGVASVLPVGLNGCRLLLGKGEGDGGSIIYCSTRSGVLNGEPVVRLWRQELFLCQHPWVGLASLAWMGLTEVMEKVVEVRMVGGRRNEGTRSDS